MCHRPETDAERIKIGSRAQRVKCKALIKYSLYGLWSRATKRHIRIASEARKRLKLALVSRLIRYLHI